MMLHDNLYRGYRTRTLSEIFPNYNDFGDFYVTCGISTTIRNTNPNDSLRDLYYLLLSRYANSPIASSDEGRFKFNVMALIFQYGPTWEKKLDIQKELRTLTAADLTKGSTAIHNHANNPSVQPSTLTGGALSYIDDQNVTKFEKSKMDGYNQLLLLLENDVTGPFLDRFKPLFSKFPAEEALLYRPIDRGDDDE